jgi:alcohol dehydrogenase (NADP+)
MKQNLEAADINLSENEVAELNALNKHYRYIDGRFWTPEGSPYTLANLWDE